MLHVLSSVPHGGAAGQETELGPQAAGTLPQRPRDGIREGYDVEL